MPQNTFPGGEPQGPIHEQPLNLTHPTTSSATKTATGNTVTMEAPNPTSNSKSQNKNEGRKKAKAKAFLSPAESAEKYSAIGLLRAKLAFAFARLCPSHVYRTLKAEHPSAASDAWSPLMNGPVKHIVLDVKTWAVSEVAEANLASRISENPGIDCGENIKLYINDHDGRRVRIWARVALKHSPSVRFVAPFLAAEYSPAYYAIRLFAAGELGWEDLEQEEIDERLRQVGEVLEMVDILDGVGGK